MIYFIQVGEDGPIKIGSCDNTKTLKRRVQTMQVSNPYPLNVIATMEGDLTGEMYLHDAFQHLRLSGEWFKNSQEIHKFIKNPQLNNLKLQAFDNPVIKRRLPKKQPKYKCNICGHEWFARKEGIPRCCPACKSYTWNKPKINHDEGRDEK